VQCSAYACDETWLQAITEQSAVEPVTAVTAVKVAAVKTIITARIAASSEHKDRPLHIISYQSCQVMSFGRKVITHKSLSGLYFVMEAALEAPASVVVKDGHAGQSAAPNAQGRIVQLHLLAVIQLFTCRYIGIDIDIDMYSMYRYMYR
jgi:hypothetical protein